MEGADGRAEFLVFLPSGERGGKLALDEGFEAARDAVFCFCRQGKDADGAAGGDGFVDHRNAVGADPDFGGRGELLREPVGAGFLVWMEGDGEVFYGVEKFGWGASGVGEVPR